MAIAGSSQAALLTSFSDDFNRANGAIGADYTLGRGGAYVISSNQLYQSTGAEPLTYLNLGTLPTATDYANGLSFTAQIDLFIPATLSASPSFGLLLNYGNTSNYSGIRFRGPAERIQYTGRSGGTNQAYNGEVLSSLLSASPDSWFTLRVSSTAAGNYGYEFFLRSDETQKVTGAFSSAVQGYTTFTGGYVGFYADNTPTSPSYLYDNFSVTVVPEPSTVALGISGLGLLFCLNRIRPRSKP